MTTQNVNTNDFFNFTANATGYINDIQIITPKGNKKNKFVSVKVCILEGEKDEPTKSFADLIVRGKQAQDILRKYREEWPTFGKKNSWFASFRIGSLYAKAYQDKEGKLQTTLGGRLLKFSYLKIGDDVIDLSEFEKTQEESQEAA